MEEISATARGPQLVIGNYSYRPDKVHGTVVQPLSAPLPAAEPQATPAPINNCPPPLPDFIGREGETAWAVALLRQGTAVVFHGEPGVGKTALLYQIAHQPFAEKFVDGIVYLNVGQQPVEDILQIIYSHFFQSGVPHKPTSDEVRQRLQPKQALLVLDDFERGGEDLRFLFHAVPSCAFLVATARRVWHQEGVRALSGLPMAEAVALVAHLLPQPLTAETQETAVAICTALKGHPLRIKQTIAAASLQNLSLSAVLGQLLPETAVESLHLRQLAQQMVAAFDNAALQALCEALEIDHRSLPGSSVAQNVPVLLDFVAQEEMMPALLVHCEAAYPDLTWGEPTQAIVDAGIAALPAEMREFLNVLAVFGEWPVSEALLSYLGDNEEISSWLAELYRYGFVQNRAYHLGGSLPYRFYGDTESVLRRVVDWVRLQAENEAALLYEAQTLAYLQQWAVAHNDAEAAWTLGRMVEEVLALNGRWDLWQQVLHATQAAAQALQDTSGEAWVLNQLGCRALCLGIDSSAQTYLARAKQLNEKRGDETAVAVNQHNLNVLQGPPPPPPSPWRRRILYLIGVGVLVLGLLIWWLTNTALTPPSVPTPTATATAVVLQTLTPLPTQTAASSSNADTESLTSTIEALPSPTLAGTPIPEP